MPLASLRKSWSLTGCGCRSQRAPGFLNLPMSSFFLVSTLMMGFLPAVNSFRRRWI